MKTESSGGHTCPENVRRYPINEQGRDFVVGDIHGAYDFVLARMAEVGFNKSVDRLFSLGDLIDRGSNCERVLRFLEQPYVHALRGNHEDMFLNASIDEIRAMACVDWNGMAWANRLSDETLMEIKAAFAKLPIAIEVETIRGTVGLVHANVPLRLNWQDFTDLLMQGDPDVIKTALWCRERYKSSDRSGVKGIDRLFVGHVPQANGPKRLGNVYFIDCGAVFRELHAQESRFLAIANLICKSSILTPRTPATPAQGPYLECGSGQFGHYTVDRDARQ